MRIHLSAGFGKRLGAMLSLIEALGYVGIRQDVPPGADVEDLVGEFPFSALVPSFLVGGGTMPDSLDVYRGMAGEVVGAMIHRNVGASIEAGNEPNLTTWSPEAFAGFVTDVEAVVHRQAPQVPVIMGGISTLSEDALDYLQRVLDAGVPGPDRNVLVGFHSYRPAGGDAHTPQRGFSSRAAEFHRLKNVVGSVWARRLWNTEVGYHDAVDEVRRKAPFCWLSRRKVQRSRQKCADCLREEIRLNAQEGVEVLTVYQLSDGPSERPIDHYGIRCLDGTLKPSAYVVREA